MKKFISMVMAAAMVVSLVPATAFAADVNTATYGIVKGLEVTEAEAVAKRGVVSDMAEAQGAIANPEVQIKLTDVKSVVGVADKYEFTLKFDGIEVTDSEISASAVKVYRGSDDKAAVLDMAVTVADDAEDKDEITVTVEEKTAKGKFTTDLKAGDIIAVSLDGLMKDTDEGSKATVKVTGDFGASEAMVFAAVVEKGIKVELDDDVVKVSPEEYEDIEDVVIKPVAGDDFNDVLNFKYAYNSKAKAWEEGTTHAKVVLNASKGFSFLNGTGNKIEVYADTTKLADTQVVYTDDDTITIYVDKDAYGEAAKITVKKLVVEATTAKAGAEGFVKVTSPAVDSVSVKVIDVVDLAVVMELVDPDEDVPTFYNGVDVQNTGLTVDDDHVSLEVKIYETFKGAWMNHKDWTLSLPEGVHVVTDHGAVLGVDADDVNGTFTGKTGKDADLVELFGEAYQRGDHEVFDFKRGSFNETHDKDDAKKAHEITFTLTLVADPDFVGDVVLTLEGALLDTQTVTIAKVLAPYTVKAEQNDVIIDYRYTEVPTAVVITEAEAGLWAEGLEVVMGVEDNATELIKFEDEATYTVNEESEMEIKEINSVNGFGFKVKEESADEAAVITVDGIELFMQRNIPAGPYALEVTSNSATTAFLNETLFAPDTTACTASDHECIVNDVDDFSSTVHEAWVNVVTAGRDQDDASFTTKIVVPVGETTMYAGEKAITLDVPAYINANDYVMLPVRAVATALGIDNNAVQWDQATKTVIIMYGQRIITMTAGQSVVYVSGTAIPAKAAVEIVDGRAFLGLRDLATTLGISNINYDATTKTATLN